MNKKLFVDTRAEQPNQLLVDTRGKRLCPELTKILNEELHDSKRGT